MEASDIRFARYFRKLETAYAGQLVVADSLCVFTLLLLDKDDEEFVLREGTSKARRTHK